MHLWRYLAEEPALPGNSGGNNSGSNVNRKAATAASTSRSSAVTTVTPVVPTVTRHETLSRGWPLLPCRKGQGRVMRTLLPLSDCPQGLPVLCPRRGPAAGGSGASEQLPAAVVECLTAVGVAVVDLDLLVDSRDEALSSFPFF